MSRLTIYLGRLIGLFLLILALSMLADSASIIEIATALVDDRVLLMLVGMMALGVGLALVLGHNVWSGGVLTVLVTLFGWSQLLRGLILLLLPADLVVGLFEALRVEDFFYVYAAIPLILGAYMTYAGFTAQSDNVT